MRVLSRGEWLDGFLDYWRADDAYRLEVDRFANLEQLDELYFVRPRNPRMVLHYLRELGPLDVARKIRARSTEHRRNEKFLSLGTGTILEAPSSGRFAVGQQVVFLAPCHPACLERLVVPEGLLAETDWPRSSDAAEHVSYHTVPERLADNDRWWQAARGWSEYAGVPLESELTARLRTSGGELLARFDWGAARRLPRQPATDVSERLGPERTRASQPARRRAVLFGWGNYAKTMTKPSMAPYCDVETVHEIDPPTVPRGEHQGIIWDTSPLLRPDERCEVCLIAGYHHTHAPLAIEAMRRGAAAVVEKPIATTRSQLEALSAALRDSGGPLFSCYQKRYHPFNELALADLGVEPGEPISYHCIVYEVPVPRLHWYRWPASGSRIISNGCHWIDHFLHLNPTGHVSAYELALGPGGTVNCSVSLDSGAMFTMVLTEAGSARLGVREHVELRARDATVTMTDGCEYRAETSRRVAARRRVHRYAAHRAMYAAIGQQIVAGAPGDSVESLERSAGLVLTLEEALQAQV